MKPAKPKQASLLQSFAHHALSNARWWLLGLMVLGWLTALGARLRFLRAEGGSDEPAILLRAWADRKELPLSIEGHGAYFRIGPSPTGALLTPLRPVLLDGAQVPDAGVELGQASRSLEVDGLRLRYGYRSKTPALAHEGWSLRLNCVTIGKSLAAEASLDLPGVPPLSARLCQNPATLENLSARFPLQLNGQSVPPGKTIAWAAQTPQTLATGDARLEVQAREGRIQLLLDPAQQTSTAIRRPTLVGNLQMQFTRILPETKADYQLLEQLQEALDHRLLDLDGSDAREAAASTAEEEETQQALKDGRVQQLLESSRREIREGRPENAHVIEKQGEIYDIRTRALSVTAPGRARQSPPLLVQAAPGAPSSPWLEVLDGPARGMRLLTDAPASNGLCDLVLTGPTEPETLFGAEEMRRCTQGLAAGRMILLSDSGPAVIRPETAGDPSKRGRVWIPIAPGETLDALIRRLALRPEDRKPLQEKILGANPGLDPRRIRAGQRIALEPWPELPESLFARAFPRLQIERTQGESFARIVHGPAEIGGTALPDGAWIPLRSGDELKLGACRLRFEDPHGILRVRKLINGKAAERYPMGEAGVLLAGFEDRLAPLAEARAGQPLGLDANLQETAAFVLRRHLEAFDGIERRRYGQKGKVHAGSLTVLDWKSGAILAAASWPAFDPEAEDGYQKAASELGPSSPFLDRNFGSLRPAGSTFKLVVLAAYLDQLEKAGKLPGPGEPVGPAFSCGDGRSAGSGAILLNGRAIRCHRASKGGHGLVHDADEAFKVSCNVYFAKLALKLSGLSWDEALAPGAPQALKFRGQLSQKFPLFDMASRLGFDFDYRGWGPADRKLLAGLREPSALADFFAPLGVSARSSPLAGALASPLHFYDGGQAELAFDGPTRPRLERKPLRHLVYTAIGQDMVVSTYHLALLAAAVANDGLLPRPWISRPAAEASGAEPNARRIFSAAVARRLRVAMEGVTSKGGTAVILNTMDQGGPFPFRIYGKTGTAQVASSNRQSAEFQRADSLFISFVDDPRLPPLAVAVRVENGDSSVEKDGALLQTTGKHLAGRFYSALMDEYGIWPDPKTAAPLPALASGQPQLQPAEPADAGEEGEAEEADADEPEADGAEEADARP